MPIREELIKIISPKSFSITFETTENEEDSSSEFFLYCHVGKKYSEDVTEIIGNAVINALKFEGETIEYDEVLNQKYGFFLYEHNQQNLVNSFLNSLLDINRKFKKADSLIGEGYVLTFKTNSIEEFLTIAEKIYDWNPPKTIKGFKEFYESLNR